MNPLKNKEFMMRFGGFFLAGFLLAMILTLLLGAAGNREGRGPYEVSSSDGHVYILDSRDGHLWERVGTIYRDLGTPQDPAYKSDQLHR